MVFILLNLFALPERLCKLLTSIIVTNSELPTFLSKAFSKFYRWHVELIETYRVSLKKLLQQDISYPEFYGDLVYKFKKIIRNPNFFDLFKRILTVSREQVIL